MEPRPDPVEFSGADDAIVAQAGSEPWIEIRRGASVLLRVRGSGLQMGSVPTLSERASYDPYWLEYGQDVLPVSPPDDLVWHHVETMRALSATAEQARFALTLSSGLSGELELQRTGEGRYLLRVLPKRQAEGRAVVYLRVRADIDENEGLYGMGEWADAVNQRGKVRPMQIELDTLESKNNENHVPVPLVIGTRAWGLFVESRRLGVFDLAQKAANAVEATFGTGEASDEGLRVHLLVAKEGRPLDILRRYHDLAGDAVLPAEWAYGPWIWRNESKNQAEVEDDIEKIRSLDLPTSAIWIDRPYATAVNTFDWKATDYPDARGMIAKAHAVGLRVALWHAPYLESTAQPFLMEAEQKGYFPPGHSAPLNGWGVPIDWTNPEAKRRWIEWVSRYRAQGIEGYKLDYAEDVVPSLGDQRNVWRFSDGSTERTGHFDYTRQYHQTYSQLLPASGGFLLCRAGRWGDQQWASVIWPGDMDATFTKHREVFRRGSKDIVGVGGLPATVVQLLTLSSSGYPFFGADTGGYRHSPPDRELFIRWMQQTALSPVMQVGDASSQPPWVFTPANGRDGATLDLYRQYARLHLRLFPYVWTVAQRMKQTGHPIVRPLGLVYPQLGSHPSDQYMLGEELLVAPVIERGAVSRAVWLPPGRWVDFWDGSLSEGGELGKTIQVAAPLEKLPLWIRAGGLVAMLRPTIDTLSPSTQADVQSYANDPGPLTVLVAPDSGWTQQTLYDGTQVGQGRKDGQHALLFRPGMRFQHGAVFEMLTPRAAVRVERAGQPLKQLADCAALAMEPEGVCFSSERGGLLRIQIAGGMQVQELRVFQ